MLNEDPVMNPGGKGWADHPLWVVQRFVNTIELNERTPSIEELTEPGVLKDFLVRYSGLDPKAKVTTTDLARAIELREALRELLVAKTHGVDPSPKALGVVNGAIADARLELVICADCYAELEPRAPGVAGALGRILAAMLDAMKDESWTRLKACERESCLWAFYDRSKNRSKNWCSMRVCGNREKVAAYRARQSV